jgi:hypothetical protein
MKTNLILILTIMVLTSLAACSGGGQTGDAAGEAGSADQPEKTAAGLYDSDAEDVTQQRVEMCRAATQKLGGALKSALQEAMGNGGPLGAITVCHDETGVITEKICEEEGLIVGRTSLKFRNPSNAPDGWEKAGLAVFEAKVAAGENHQDLEMWTTVTDADGGRTFRYLKAIGTGPLCLNCHGEELAPDLASTLGELYPGDQARGFAVGDLRGAFTVTLELPRSGADGL